MSATREEIDRKQELLDRYRALRLEEILDELRQRAEHESHQGRFPWRGQFRSRAEIEDLYRQRRRWDRRVLFDLTLLIALCAALLLLAPLLLRILLPD
ncbi:MAG: hypothetical protein ISR76_09055 [Planctomycetes bacterium]|nr:hypothetical protein [Planctomycetota bacterium]MBL7009133.1 hypothetical protein [Planctomycetota bacterium]